MMSYFKIVENVERALVEKFGFVDKDEYVKYSYGGTTVKSLAMDIVDEYKGRVIYDCEDFYLTQPDIKEIIKEFYTDENDKRIKVVERATIIKAGRHVLKMMKEAMPYDEVKEEIKLIKEIYKIYAKYDFNDFIEYGCPLDEYSPEAKELLKLIELNKEGLEGFEINEESMFALTDMAFANLLMIKIPEKEGKECAKELVDLLNK